MSTSVKSLIDISKQASLLPLSLVPLRKPGSCDHRQLLPQLPEKLRTFRNGDNGFLNGAPCNVRRFVQQLACIQLSCTRYTKHRGWKVALRRSTAEREIREILGGSIASSALQCTVPDVDRTHVRHRRGP